MIISKQFLSLQQGLRLKELGNIIEWLLFKAQITTDISFEEYYKENIDKNVNYIYNFWKKAVALL